MSFGIFIAFHNRIAESLAHLDILKYLEIPHEVFVLYSGTQDLAHIPNVIRFCPRAHAPVIGVLRALREARERKLEYLLYRNGDDWLFNHVKVEEWLNKLRDHDIVFYNWFGKNSFDDVTVNELLLRVEAFNHLDLDAIERQMCEKQKFDPERDLAKILRPTATNSWRISDREINSGIGHQTSGKLDPHHHRWFHRTLQLIGWHDPWQRWESWKSIRLTVPYHEELERERYFGAWMNVCMKLDRIAPQIVLDGRTLLNGPKLFHIGDAILQTAGLSGDCAEVGVYKGGFLKYAANLVPAKTVHGFDTFAGIPAACIADGKHAAGEFACGLSDVQAYVTEKNVEFHDGIFPDTAIGLEDRRFCFVHLDVDTYQGTLAAIDFFWPRMVPSGYLVIDDYNWEKTAGVTKAIHERFTKEEICVRPESDHQAFIRKCQKAE